MEYQGIVMTRAIFPALFSLAVVSCAGLAAAQAAVQSPAPPQSATPAPRVSAANPANVGRLQLDQYLDAIAAQYEASRAAAVANIDTHAQAEARQAKVRSQILSLIGGLPQRTPLHARLMGETQADGFRIRKLIFESQPDFFVTALLYVPSGEAANSKRAAILITPGHVPTGKVSDAAMAAIFARNGFIVLSYDPIG